jgi:hypothetical protein
MSGSPKTYLRGEKWKPTETYRNLQKPMKNVGLRGLQINKFPGFQVSRFPSFRKSGNQQKPAETRNIKFHFADGPSVVPWTVGQPAQH